MKIVSIDIYEMEAPIPGGVYRLSGGRTYTFVDLTVVAVHTDAGIIGWGELGTLGTNYLPAYGRGARTAIREIAPALVGRSPLDIECVNEEMDHTLAGHDYAKSPLDIACWDIFGKTTGMPVCVLLGGHFGGPIDLVSAIPTDTPAKMAESVAQFRARRYCCHSVKLGGDVHEDIARIRAVRAKIPSEEELHVDCNRGWTMDQALRVMRSVDDLDLYFEQPCASYDECLAVRNRTGHPIILDEIVDNAEMMLRVVQDRAADMINIKISRVGGLTKARRIREICRAAGLPVSLQDTGGSGLTQAAILHLAQSTPERLRRSLYNPLDYCPAALVQSGLQAEKGRLEAPSAVGLGVAALAPELLGSPLHIE